jgi:hypothetical protein
VLTIASVLASGVGCARTNYASPAAAQTTADMLPLLTYPVFKNRTVTVRVLDNRMDRPQSVVLVDQVRGLVEGSLSRAQLGKGSEPAAVFEVRIVRYGAESKSQDLALWRACVGFGATVEIGSDVRHQLVSERCAVTENVWGTESADQVLRVAFREASSDLLSQVDVLRAPAPAAKSPAPVEAPAAAPGTTGAEPAPTGQGPAEPAPATP